jgi:hypothetical protein
MNDTATGTLTLIFPLRDFAERFGLPTDPLPTAAQVEAVMDAYIYVSRVDIEGDEVTIYGTEPEGSYAEMRGGPGFTLVLAEKNP